MNTKTEELLTAQLFDAGLNQMNRSKRIAALNSDSESNEFRVNKELCNFNSFFQNNTFTTMKLDASGSNQKLLKGLYTRNIKALKI